MDEAPSLTQLNWQVNELLHQVDLTELLLEIYAHTGFAEEFTHVSELNSRADDVNVSICEISLADARVWRMDKGPDYGVLDELLLLV